MTDSTLNMRSLMLPMLLVILFTGSMIWINRGEESPEYAQYENYGISLQYPEQMSLGEWGFRSESPVPLESSGIVQCLRGGGNDMEIFEVMWVVEEGTFEADRFLDGFPAMVTQSDSVTSEVGERFTLDFHGEDLKCMYIELVEDRTFSGIVGAVGRPWSTQGSSRVFYLIYVTNKGLQTDEQMLASFKTYIEGLNIQ